MRKYHHLMRSTLASLGAFALLLIPSVVFAEEVFVPLTTLPGIGAISSSGDGLSTFLNTVYRLCVGAAAVIAVIQITRAGIVYMLQDSLTEKKEARHLINMSLLGLLLVLAPTIVFSVIDQRILSLKIDATGLALGEPGAIDSTITPVTPGGGNDPFTSGEGCSLPRGGNAERYHSLVSIGNGSEENGRGCCTDELNGVIVSRGNPPQQQCDLGDPEDASAARYILYGTARGTIRVQTSGNTVEEKPNTSLRIFTLGTRHDGYVLNDAEARRSSFESESACASIRDKTAAEVATYIKSSGTLGMDKYDFWSGGVAVTATSLVSLSSVNLRCKALE
jgi:hypothetical protein